MVNILADLVTKEVAPVAWLYADRVDQAAPAVRLAPGQRLVTVEVCLGLCVGVVGQLERDTARAVGPWLVGGEQREGSLWPSGRICLWRSPY